MMSPLGHLPMFDINLMNWRACDAAGVTGSRTTAPPLSLHGRVIRMPLVASLMPYSASFTCASQHKDHTGARK